MYISGLRPSSRKHVGLTVSRISDGCIAVTAIVVIIIICRIRLTIEEFDHLFYRLWLEPFYFYGACLALLKFPLHAAAKTGDCVQTMARCALEVMDWHCKVRSVYWLLNRICESLNILSRFPKPLHGKLCTGPTAVTYLLGPKDTLNTGHYRCTEVNI